MFLLRKDVYKRQAKKNLVKVPILKGTVPHEQSARFGGAEVFIKPASHGTGVRCV